MGTLSRCTNLLDLLSWEEEELKVVPAQQVFTLDDHGQGSYLRTNQVNQICGLITYMKHVFREYNSGIEVREDPFHPFLPEEWSQHTSTMLRTFLIQHLPKPIGPEPVISGPIPSSRPTGYSPAAIELMGFKKGNQKVMWFDHLEHMDECQEKYNEWENFWGDSR